MLCSLLNLLAFLAHMMLERGDHLSQRGLATTSRRELWHTLRTAMRCILVSRGAQMLRLYRDEVQASPSRAWSWPGPTASGPLQALRGEVVL